MAKKKQTFQRAARKKKAARQVRDAARAEQAMAEPAKQEAKPKRKPRKKAE